MSAFLSNPNKFLVRLQELKRAREMAPYCGDSSCYFSKRQGQHTNGGCRCIENNPREVERYARRLQHKLPQLIEACKVMYSALSYYADESNWNTYGGSIYDAIDAQDWECNEDFTEGCAGKMARETLAKIEGANE